MSAAWQRQPLGAVLDVASGQVDPKNAPYSAMPHIGGENIESGTGRLLGVSTAGDLGLTSGKYLFGPTDVLYSKIRPRLNKVVAPTFEGICSADIYPLRPRRDRIAREFLVHLLRSADFLTYTEKHSSRTNIPKLNREGLLGYELALPPLEEQRRIAEVLDRAEALRTKRRAALAQLDTLTQSIFHDLFGDPARNPRGLDVVAIGDVVKLKSGMFLPADEMAAGGTFPVLGGNGVNGFHDKCMFEERQIVIGRVGAYCGCVHLSPPNCWVTDNALYVSECSQRLQQIYLTHALIHAKLNQYASQSGQPLVSGSRIYPAKILVPPMALQETFARRLASVERLKSAQGRSLAELDALFAALQHRAFRGEL